MSGRHDRSTDGERSSNPLLTGPIVVRGLTRGVRRTLGGAAASRHRAPGDEPDPTPGAESADDDRAAGGSVARPSPEGAVTAPDAGSDGPREQGEEQREQEEASEQEPRSRPAATRAPRKRAAPASPKSPAAPSPHRSGLADASDPAADATEPEDVAPDAPPPTPIAPEPAPPEPSPAEPSRTRTRSPARARSSSRAGTPPPSPAEPAPTPVEPASTPTESTAAQPSRSAASGPSGSSPDPDASTVTVGPEPDPPARAAERLGESVPPATVRAPGAATGRPPRRPLRDRIGRETVGIAVLVVLALICAGLIAAVVQKTQADAAAAAREAAAYTPPPLAGATPSATPAAPVVVVIGDESALRAAAGVGSAQRWPQLLGGALGARVVVRATAGAGYASAGTGGSTFVGAAGRVPADAAAVVFVGGAADAGRTSLEIARAATQAFAAATGRAPKATVVAVGPLFLPADATGTTALRTAVESAARIASVRWVDPVGSAWLSGVTAIADLTGAQERTISARLRPVLRSAVG